VIVVPDAGPLIYLAGAGQLELLPALYSQVVVPRIVFDEIVVAGAGLTGAREVEGANWLQVQEVPVEPSLLATLDRGEAAAIPLAERLGATLLADDGRAREVARERSLVVIGTLGVLLVAKKKGLLVAIRPIVIRMEALGMFVSAQLREAVLAAAAEPDR
jgi:predicted nucleic acid-binding protein